MKISVVIPYFQRKSGILRRALNSVLAQELPPDVLVHVIVVDDGSPITAAVEVEGLSFAPPFSLQIIARPNGGVAVARNTGLQAVGEDSDCIAFLDSDDIWHPAHLATAAGAMREGFDFYFCDNKRRGSHNSYFSACSPILLTFARDATGGYVALSRDDALHAILTDFPTQASTTLHRRGLCPGLRFDERFRFAGEDVFFFTQLAAAAKKVGFRNEVLVECADGINLYFGNFGWDSPRRIPIACDQIATHTAILQTVPMSAKNAAWLKKLISSYENDFVFLCVRYFVKNCRWPPELAQMAEGKSTFPFWFGAQAAKIAVLKPLGVYRPK